MIDEVAANLLRYEIYFGLKTVIYGDQSIFDIMYDFSHRLSEIRRRGIIHLLNLLPNLSTT